MTTIPHLVDVLRAVLGPTADTEAKRTGFVQRQSKLTGAKFVQALVFGWLENPEATLEELSQTAMALGVSISPQGLDQRFSPCAADLLQAVLERAVQEVIASEPIAIPLLQRFAGVYILDSSTVALPEILATLWAGCGNQSHKPAAALKIHLRLEMTTGALAGPVLSAGRLHDRSCSLPMESLPSGALRLADLGYFSLAAMKAMTEQGVYWLSRLQANTAVFDDKGQRRVLSHWLDEQGDTADMPITVGAQERMPCRLVARRVPDGVANERRRHLNEEAERRKQPVSEERLRLAAWTFYITNVPASLLSVAEAMVFGRLRWQIELLIKLWKSHGHIDESRSRDPWRIMCEVCAKLLAMLVQHWLLLVSCWRYADRSLTKAVKTVRKHARHLEVSFAETSRLIEAIEIFCQCLVKGCRINKSRNDPRTYQLLAEPLG
ncbi:MAG: IS4 family transposase [Chloroflexi bacterium]|nr:IS4 family transposase [Chloroflexota bacterium]